MPKPPQPVNKPNHTYQIRLNIPGWLKNQIIQQAQKQNMTINEYISVALFVAVRNETGLPVAPVGRALPSVDDQLRAYLSGEKLLMPCGRVSCGFDSVLLGGVEFCGVCGIRVG